MIKKSKFKLLMLSVLLPVLLMSSRISALTKVQTNESVSDSISESAELPKNKIEEKDGIITVNDRMVFYIPDSEIKIIDDDLTNTQVKFVKPEELSNE